MASIITLPQLIELLAKNGGIANCGNLETTAYAFFEAITDALKTDRTVKIKNFGSFAISEDNDQKLSFIPCKEIEKAVNAPFEFFEPVELGDNVTDEMLAEADMQPEPESKILNDTDETTESVIADETVEDIPNVEATTVAENLTDEEPEPCDNQPEQYNDPENKCDKDEDGKIVYVYKNVFPWWYALIGGIASGCIIGIFLLFLMPAYYTADENEQEYEIVASDTMPATVATVEHDKDSLPAQEEIVEEITATENPANKVITDTVSSRRFLTTMARQYYGEMAFWAYIYIENSDKLGNPDRIAPNTVVVIPPAEKYNIDKMNPKSVDDAKQKGLEIYSKYRK